MATKLTLLPMPRQVRLGRGGYAIPQDGWIQVRPDEAQDLIPAVAALQEGIYQFARRVLKCRLTRPNDPRSLAVRLSVEPARVKRAQGYTLRISDAGVTVRGNDPAGVFYGVQTVVQLARQYGSTLPSMSLSDWPDILRRGVVLDISRDKVPTMATLRRLVGLLASLKMNELQLYTEHTFAYRRHSLVWASASPMSPDEVRELDSLCRRHFIDLVPNQNSFGHLERWLQHRPYRPLAECPNGCVFPWGRIGHPFSLSPAVPGSLELLAELYEELLPCFTSRFVNVGCDETFDLGQGRSKALCRERGTQRVYLDFLLAVQRLVARHKRTMMYWGDIVLRHPEVLDQLPRDAIALLWGYEADHPFDRDCALVAQSGIPFYVCPGTSTWCSVAGRADNAMLNLRAAAESGLRHGARGYLVTAWGDAGHWDPLPMAYLGFAYGAAASWCADTNPIRGFAKPLSLHALDDPSGQAGYAAFDLGNAYKVVGKLCANSSALWQALMSPLTDAEAVAGVTEEGVSAALDVIRRGADRIRKARLGATDAELVRAEFLYAARLLEHACERMRLMLGARVSRRDLAADMTQLIETHRSVWLARNRVGGLDDSVGRLERLVTEYRNGP